MGSPVLVAGTSAALIPAIIGAVGAVASALILGFVAWRAQSAQDQLQDIELLLRRYIDQIREGIHDDLREILDARTRGLYIAEIVKRGLREVLREDYRDRLEDDDDDRNGS